MPISIGTCSFITCCRERCDWAFYQQIALFYLTFVYASSGMCFSMHRFCQAFPLVWTSLPPLNHVSMMNYSLALGKGCSWEHFIGWSNSTDFCTVSTKFKKLLGFFFFLMRFFMWMEHILRITVGFDEYSSISLKVVTMNVGAFSVSSKALIYTGGRRHSLGCVRKQAYWRPSYNRNFNALELLLGNVLDGLACIGTLCCCVFNISDVLYFSRIVRPCSRALMDLSAQSSVVSYWHNAQQSQN